MDSTRANTIAAFDLDGTLTEGGSVFRWLRFVAGGATTYRAALRLIVPLSVGALRSGHYADDAKERLFRALLRGRDEATIREVSRDFARQHLLEHGRTHVLERVRWHLGQGHDVVIVSASPQLYVDVIAEELEVSGGLGTRLAVDAAGRFTGDYLGKNCRGSEKLRRLREWMESRTYSDEPTIYAYGNSRGDRRLLLAASHPFDVGKLGALGALRHFPRLPSVTAGE